MTAQRGASPHKTEPPCSQGSGQILGIAASHIGARGKSAPVTTIIVAGSTLRATSLIPFPAAALLPPVLSVTFPAVRDPVVAVPRSLPVTGLPVMTMPRPAPEPANPDLSDDWRPAHIFDPRRRRRHDDRLAVVVVRPISGNDRTAACDCGSRQQDAKKPVSHARAFRYCDKVCAINVKLPETPTQPALLYKLLQFSAHAPISDEHPGFDANYPAASMMMRTGRRTSNLRNSGLSLFFSLCFSRCARHG